MNRGSFVSDNQTPLKTLVLELAPHQGDEAARRASASGFVDVAVHRDLTDRPRVLLARR